MARGTAAAGCLHCGLPIPANRLARGDAHCCDGCARVRALLLGEGLDRYYELRGAAGTPPPELRPGGRAWLEEALPPAAARGDRPVRLTLDVQGVHCAGCVWLLRELFRRREGAIDVVINPSRGQADLVFVPSRLDLSTYLDDVERFGYRFGPRRPRAVRPASEGLLVRLAVCAAAAGNVMLFSISYYSGLGAGDGTLYAVFGWLSLALTTVAVAAGGSVFFRSAIAGLRARVAHLDLPIALGIALAFAGSVRLHFARGPEHAYYDTVASFVTLMLAGRVLQERVLERNRASVLASPELESLIVRRVRDGRIEPVPASRIAAGDELCVVAGDLVPVAGALLEGTGTVALDWITGEPGTSEVAAGETVPAGAFNAGTAPMRLAALEGFAESRLHDLLASPAPPAPGRGPGAASLFWHRAGSAWVAGVILLAAAGFLSRLGEGIETAAAIAISILVVTCPCAIGLAVPLGRELAYASLRREGVFVRDATFLDRALRVRRVLFDKTGTLTLGRLAPDAATIEALRSLGDGDREVLAAMASRSNHPVSRAVAEALDRLGPAASANPPAVELVEAPGRGLEARALGACFRLGRPSFAVTDPPAGSEGETWLSRDDSLVARLAFGEEIRSDARDEVSRLRERGLDVRILSGDRPARVLAVAEALGLPADACEGGLEPEGKAGRVASLDRRDTLMVGDGVNDAPAFAAAFCTATPAVDRPSIPARADFYFLGGGIAAVRQALETAALAGRVQSANLVFAAVYNAGAVALCLAGAVGPLVGGGAHARQLPGGRRAHGRAHEETEPVVDVLIVLVFVCLVLVTGAVLLFIMRTRAGDLDHGERLSLLPLEPDAGEGEGGRRGGEGPGPSSGTGEAPAPGGAAGASREGGAE